MIVPTNKLMEMGSLPEVALSEIRPDLSLKEVQSHSFEGLNQPEQVERLSAYMNGLEDLRYENWERLGVDERIEALQKVENEAARLGNRQPLKVAAVNYHEWGPIVTNGSMDWQSHRICINARLLSQSGMGALGQVTQTVVHEGRHAYQFSNIYVRRVEPGNEKFDAWRMNLQTGYLSCERYGFKRYSMQPVEVDARIFAEEVRSKVIFR